MKPPKKRSISSFRGVFEALLGSDPILKDIVEATSPFLRGCKKLHKSGERVTGSEATSWNFDQIVLVIRDECIFAKNMYHGGLLVGEEEARKMGV